MAELNVRQEMAMLLYTARFDRDDHEYVLVYGFRPLEESVNAIIEAIEADMNLRVGKERGATGVFDRGLEDEMLTEDEEKKFKKRAVVVERCGPHQVFLLIIPGEKIDHSDPRYILRVGSPCRGFSKEKLRNA